MAHEVSDWPLSQEAERTKAELEATFNQFAAAKFSREHLASPGFKREDGTEIMATKIKPWPSFDIDPADLEIPGVNIEKEFRDRIIRMLDQGAPWVDVVGIHGPMYRVHQTGNVEDLFPKG